jgi:transcriptional regulator with XRE-family HTH domain
MGTNAVQRAATANTVSANVRRLRGKQNLGLRGLSKLLGEVGRPLTHSAVDQIEKGARRVDVDDLMALAAALNVSPITLLMPETSTGEETVQVTGRPPDEAGAVWDWLRAMLLRENCAEFLVASNPPWAFKGSLLAAAVRAEQGVHRGNDREL